MLAEQLDDVSPALLSEDERLAFWINLHNALLLHTFLVDGYPTTHAKRIALLNQATFTIRGTAINAFEIEFSILRAQSFRSSLATALKVRRFPPSDHRSSWQLQSPHPNVSFALCSGTFSAPLLKVFSPRTVRAELEEAREGFLELAVGLSRDNRLVLPKILD
ncbi:unnamed protein product, partial [Closterium sp. NIES-54]